MRNNSSVRHGSLLGGLVALLALLAVAPVAQAGKAVKGTFGAPGGEGNGQLHEPRGLAVNLTGAGGVSPGDVYVVDSLNNRVEEFSAAGAFVRAFGYDVVASGPDNTGADEQQTLTVDATGGTFAVKVTRKTSIDATEGSNVIAHLYAPTSAFHVGDVVEGAFPAGTTITAVGTESLVLSAAATSNSREFGATETTAPIPYNGTAGELEAALEVLPAIGAGNVAVTGTDATIGLTIEYKGALGHDDIFDTKASSRRSGGSITAISTALTGGVTHTATVATTSHGGGYEVCDASAPSDVCKGGPGCNRGESSIEACQESYAAGSLKRPSGVTVDQQNGNVYVTDITNNSLETNNRINVYSSTGIFEGSFGWDVDASSPKEELQFCTVVTGCQFGSQGPGAGQLNGIDDRSSPAMGPNGHLYVPEAGVVNSVANDRVDEFVPVLNGSEEVTGVSFAGAVGWDVVASGPDQANEAQKVTVRASAGKFKLAFKSVTTGELAFDAPASEAEEVSGGPESVEKALNALSSVNSGGGSVTVTGGPGDAGGSAPYNVTFDGGPLAHTDVAQMVATKVGLSGGNPATGVSVETYSNGTEGLEHCVVARGDVCKAGVPGVKLGQFAEGTPSSVAVDESGALYAVDNPGSLLIEPPARVYKFTFPGPGEVTAEEFAPEYLTQTSGVASAVEATNVFVDPVSQNVLVAKMESAEGAKLYEFDSSGTLLDTSPGSEAGLHVTFILGLAIGTSGRVYVSNGGLGIVDILGPPPPPSVSIAAATAVGAGSATLHGTVTPPPPVEGASFDTTYYFEYSLDGVEWARVQAEDVDVGDGSGSGPPNTCPVNNPPSCTVEQTVTGLVPNSHYLVRLVASTGTAVVSGAESFTTQPGPPLVTGAAAEEITETSAKLSGIVNPVNEATTYHFEWGTDTSYGNQVPVETEGSAGSGGQPVTVSAPVEGLKAGTIYHFRLLATNPSGTTEGPDREFSSLDLYRLPDGRAPEQVSPSDKRPAGMVAHTLEGNIIFQASSDGNAIIYPLLNGAAAATAGGDVDYVGERGESGWLATQLTPPSLVPAVDQNLGEDATGHVRYASADLSCEIIESFEPLTADTPAVDVADGVHNLYRRSADGTYTLLTAAVPLNPSDGRFDVYRASADCNHVLFSSTLRFLEEAATSSTLYEWAEGTLRVAGVIPDESAPSGESVSGGAEAGLGGHNTVKFTSWNAISRDGSKIFFSAFSRSGADKGNLAVFARENGLSTVDVSQSKTATADANANYAGASIDGSHVFFIANYGLATNATSGGLSKCNGGAAFASGVGCDLYDYNTITKTLTDLSADANSADTKGAGVAGLVDISDDGSYVYFAARGQLVAGKGRSEAQNLQGSRTYNVYLTHEGELSYVGLIADSDTESTESGTDMSFDFNHWVADATPDGKHLLFVSKANVTGYDSKGVAEAYLYSTTGGEVACVSCRTDGLPSIGNVNTEPVTINPPETSPRSSNTIYNRRRSISDDGRRVFFTMPDALTVGARSGANNIYEWEAGHVYLLIEGQEIKPDPTVLADISADGRDVFVVTKSKLVARDFDNTTDIYDLRAGGGFPEPEPPVPPCDPLSDKCQGEAIPRLFGPPGPASEVFAGTGNSRSAIARCGKGLVLLHGKCLRKKPVTHKKRVVKHCRKGHVHKHGKCVRKASVAGHARAINNTARAAR